MSKSYNDDPTSCSICILFLCVLPFVIYYNKVVSEQCLISGEIGTVAHDLCMRAHTFDADDDDVIGKGLEAIFTVNTVSKVILAEKDSPNSFEHTVNSCSNTTLSTFYCMMGLMSL